MDGVDSDEQKEFLIEDEEMDGAGNRRQPLRKRWFFTFNNYSDHIKNGLDGFSNMLDKDGLYVFQEEVGKEGTPHLQGCIEFHKETRPNEKYKDYKGKIWWRKTRDWNKCKAYCSKVKSRAGKHYTNIPGLKPEREILIHEPKGWQLELVNIVKEIPDERTVHWYWSKNGNVGKTAIAKYLVVKHGATYVNGKACDMKFAIAKLIEKTGIAPEIVICGYPRELSSHQISYNGIEQIKDGLFFSTKFESTTCVFNSPHIIILANTPPCKEKLSEDRWHIVEVDSL